MPKVLVTAVQGRVDQGKDWSNVQYVSGAPASDLSVQGLPTVKLQCTKAQADKIAIAIPAVYDFNVDVEFQYGKNQAVLKSFELIGMADEFELLREGIVSRKVVQAGAGPSRPSSAAASSAAK